MAHVIKVCMGSSCFARGNAKNLQLIQNFLEQNEIDAVGPNITIDGVEYHNVDNGTLLDILEKNFRK